VGCASFYFAGSPWQWAGTRPAALALAAGRYAVEWLPEFLILFDQIVDEDGEEAAFDWALRELMLSLKPSLAVRIERALRFVHRVWKIYQRTVGD
jgi:hypothetical protein